MALSSLFSKRNLVVLVPLSLAVLLFVLAFVLPAVFLQTVNDALNKLSSVRESDTQQLCDWSIQLRDAAALQGNAFALTQCQDTIAKPDEGTRSQNRFEFLNVSNALDVVHHGAKPYVTRTAVYVFEEFTNKFNWTFTDDQVQFFQHSVKRFSSALSDPNVNPEVDAIYTVWPSYDVLESNVHALLGVNATEQSITDAISMFVSYLAIKDVFADLGLTNQSLLLQQWSNPSVPLSTASLRYAHPNVSSTVAFEYDTFVKGYLIATLGSPSHPLFGTLYASLAANATVAQTMLFTTYYGLLASNSPINGFSGSAYLVYSYITLFRTDTATTLAVLYNTQTIIGSGYKRLWPGVSFEQFSMAFNWLVTQVMGQIVPFLFWPRYGALVVSNPAAPASAITKIKFGTQRYVRRTINELLHQFNDPIIGYKDSSLFSNHTSFADALTSARTKWYTVGASGDRFDQVIRYKNYASLSKQNPASLQNGGFFWCAAAHELDGQFSPAFDHATPKFFSSGHRVSASSELLFWVPIIYQSARFWHGEPSEVKGVSTLRFAFDHEFTLSTRSSYASSRDVVVDGLIPLRCPLEGPRWTVHLPTFTYASISQTEIADGDVANRFQTFDEPMFMEVEPLTGKAIQLQMFLGMSYPVDGVYVPVLELRQTAVLSDSQASELRDAASKLELLHTTIPAVLLGVSGFLFALSACLYTRVRKRVATV